MIIIGERLNSTRRPVLDALRSRNADFLIGEALAQQEAGAAFIDLNTAALLDGEVEALDWIIPLIQERVGIPLSIDTPNLKAMEKGLARHRGRALLNSLSGESRRIEEFLPLIREHRPKIVALCLDDGGLPETPEKETEIARRLVSLLEKQGIPREDLFLDPLVRPIGVDPESGRLFLDALSSLKKEFPDVKTVAGISNVSFGLPRRGLVNRTFLNLALSRGLDAAILNPLDPEIVSVLSASRALLGSDPGLRGFLALARKSGRS